MNTPLRRAVRAGLGSCCAQRSRATLAALAVVLTFTGCNRDAVVDPALRAPKPDATAAHTVVTSLGTYTIPIAPTNTNNDAVQPTSNTGIIVPAGSYYRVRINGSVIVSPNPAHQAAYPGNSTYSASGTYGPPGRNWYDELRVQLRRRNTAGGATAPLYLFNAPAGTLIDSARTDVLYAEREIEIQAGRNGIGGVTSDNCCYWSIGHYALVASQIVTVEKLTDMVHMTADPVKVRAGQQVKFTAIRDDGSTYVDQWYWQTDDGRNQALFICSHSNVCYYSPPAKGWTTVWTAIGYAQMYPMVYNGDLRLLASSSNVTYGDSVTFTPTYDGVAGPAGRWRWVPADTADHDTVACAAFASPCKKMMGGSGTMWVYTGTTGGDSASAHVTVSPPQLHVVASPNYVYQGDTVEFTVTAVGGTPDVVSWTWTDDPVVVANRIPVTRPVVPVASTAPGAEYVRSPVGNDLSPRPSPSFLSIQTPCAAHTSDCGRVITASGVMHVQAVVNGIAVEDSAHVTVADLAHLPSPPTNIAQPDGDEMGSSSPSWCPGSPTVYLASSVIRTRLKLLSDSTLLELLEHGSFAFSDSASGTITVGAVIEGGPTNMLHRMTPPPQNACLAMHAHPDGVQYRVGPSPDDNFYSFFFKLGGFVITKDYIYFIDTSGKARAVSHRTG